MFEHVEPEDLLAAGVAPGQRLQIVIHFDVGSMRATIVMDISWRRRRPAAKSEFSCDSSELTAAKGRAPVKTSGHYGVARRRLPESTM